MCVCVCVHTLHQPLHMQVDSTPSGPPLVIESMTHLAKLTYEEYSIRLSAIQHSQMQVGREGRGGTSGRICSVYSM